MVMSEFLDRHAHLQSPVHRLDAALKIALTLAFAVIIVSTPCEATRAFLCYATLVLGALVLSRVPCGYFVARLLLVLPFIAMVACFLPFLPGTPDAGSYNLGLGAASFRSPGWVLWNVTVKALLGASAVILLTSTTPFAKLLAGLRRLWVPRLLILLMSFGYRYLFVLADEARRMKRACDARAYRGRWLWQSAVIGRLIGMLFLRSFERGERVYLAMASRGFDGGFPSPGNTHLRAGDLLRTAVAAALLFSIRFCAA